MKKDKLFLLDKKNIVITGSSGLLGDVYANVVLRYGGNPILIDSNKKSLDIQKKKIANKYKKNVMALNIDITNEDDIKKSIPKILKKFRKIDALINNAANNPKVEKNNKLNFSRLENFDLKDWENDIDVGLKGSFLCAKYYGAQISKNKNGGTIINISSDLGLIAPDQRLYEKKNLTHDLQPVKPVTYSVVKSGIIGLTRYLATYWSNKNVRCNAICPGGVENQQSKLFLNRVANLIPLKRLAKKDEYQGIIIFLLSDSASYLNGAIIPIDGGRSVW